MKIQLYPRTWSEAKRRRKHVYTAIFIASIIAGLAMSILIYNGMDIVTASLVEQVDSKARWAVAHSYGLDK